MELILITLLTLYILLITSRVNNINDLNNTRLRILAQLIINITQIIILILHIPLRKPEASLTKVSTNKLQMLTK